MNVAQYLLAALARRGVRHLFGVPGDYSLPFLDQVLAHGQLAWVGNTNELNAGYAAEGYARMRGLGAAAFTYGVGELSAINAIAGAYAEHIPIVVIVGVPDRRQRDTGAVMHHGLGDGDWEHFLRMYREVTVAQATLEPATAAREIERVLAAAEQHRRPVYLAIPSDLADAPLTDMSRSTAATALADEQQREAFHSAAQQLATGRQRAVLLLGHESARFGLASRVQRLAQETGIPVAITATGKGVVDEDAVTWLGLYNGAAGEPAIRAAVENAPLLIRIGSASSDLETAGFTARFDGTRIIDVRTDHSIVAGRRFTSLPMAAALEVLGAVLGCGWDSSAPPRIRDLGPEGRLTQAALWPRVAAALRPGDLVVVGSGTTVWGMLDEKLSSGVRYLSQPFWGSIGGSLPATLGAALAAPNRRAILMMGDGSLQLTVQELATIARWKLPVTIMLINNHGYTIERVIDGETAVYNDIPRWNHRDVVRAITGVDDLPVTEIHSTGELDAALAEFNRSAPRLRLLEFHTDLLDVPHRLHTFVSTLAAPR